eukprot:6455145-Amphidinium_carterae.3
MHVGLQLLRQFPLLNHVAHSICIERSNRQRWHQCRETPVEALAQGLIDGQAVLLQHDFANRAMSNHLDSYMESPSKASFA